MNCDICGKEVEVDNYYWRDFSLDIDFRTFGKIIHKQYMCMNCYYLNRKKADEAGYQHYVKFEED